MKNPKAVQFVQQGGYLIETSAQGTTRIIHDGYCFTIQNYKHKVSKETTVWRCNQRRLNCTARAILSMSTGTLEVKGYHNHPRPPILNQNFFLQ